MPDTNTQVSPTTANATTDETTLDKLATRIAKLEVMLNRPNSMKEVSNTVVQALSSDGGRDAVRQAVHTWLYDNQGANPAGMMNQIMRDLAAEAFKASVPDGSDPLSLTFERMVADGRMPRMLRERLDSAIATTISHDGDLRTAIVNRLIENVAAPSSSNDTSYAFERAVLYCMENSSRVMDRFSRTARDVIQSKMDLPGTMTLTLTRPD